MSIKLSNGEEIIKSYDYGTVKVRTTTSTRNITVTNKRIIHSEIGAGIASERVSVQEMPVKSAKYVDTYYGMKSYTILLILGIIFALFAFISLFSGGGGPGIAVFFVMVIIAALLILVYFFKKDYVLTCSISTETLVTTSFSFATRAGTSRTRGIFASIRQTDNMFTNVKVKVNKVVAKALAEELGAVIANVASNDYSEQNSI